MARILACSRSAARFAAAPYNWWFSFQVVRAGVASPARIATTARATISSTTENPQEMCSRRIQVPSKGIRMYLSESKAYTTNRRWCMPSKWIPVLRSMYRQSEGEL